MSARQFYYAEGLAEQTATTSSAIDVATLNFTPDQNSDYLLVWSAMVACTVVGGQTTIRLWDNVGSAELIGTEQSMKDATDYVAAYGAHRASFGVSPATQTYKVQVVDFSTGNSLCKEARVCALKLTANDQFAASDGDSSTTSATLQDKTTLNFTPASPGDYLIVATAYWRLAGASSQVEVALNVDGTLFGDASLREILNSSFQKNVWGTVVKVLLSATAHTIKIQFASSDGATAAHIQFARIAAIRLDAFDNAYYAESRGDSNTTSSSPQDKAALTATPEPVNHLVLACAQRMHSSTTDSALTKLVEGGSNLIAEASAEGRVSSTTIRGVDPWLQIIKRSGSGATTTWKTQYRTEASARTDIVESAIAVLQLDATPAPGSMPQGLVLLGAG